MTKFGYLTAVTKTGMAGAENERKERESEKWEQNRELEMKLLHEKARIQVRFCSHFSLSRSPCSFLAPSPCFGDILINVMLDYFSCCRIWP